MTNSGNRAQESVLFICMQKFKKHLTARWVLSCSSTQKPLTSLQNKEKGKKEGINITKIKDKENCKDLMTTWINSHGQILNLDDQEDTTVFDRNKEAGVTVLPTVEDQTKHDSSMN